MTSKEIKRCTYHPVRSPLCPIFLVRDILNYTGQDVHALANKGGEIGINIEWKCNLDWDEKFCKPVYSFSRLDAPFAKNPVSQGYNFRFARYYKKDDGMDYRTLVKAHAIRFDILVTGNAGKFSTIPTLINMVAAFTSIGLGTVLCDIILLNFMKGADQYKAKKFEEVSEAQIEASLSHSQVSQLSLKPETKNLCDSGAISLSNDLVLLNTPGCASWARDGPSLGLGQSVPRPAAKQGAVTSSFTNELRCKAAERVDLHRPDQRVFPVGCSSDHRLGFPPDFLFSARIQAGSAGGRGGASAASLAPFSGPGPAQSSSSGTEISSCCCESSSSESAPMLMSTATGAMATTSSEKWTRRTASIFL
ncbi:P2X purinoceptor 3 [Merluccius polli]|uniref:P2X purinoceptor n=1 Tax=Merluccius polli TaxID=89951 RepID=A0AA47P3N1_MERPO|nr:P2X purinoceptor 3 [Merluccius polli]